MSGPKLDDPILGRFRQALIQAYGEKLERVILFGSRARGDARADSDYDIAIFLKTGDSFNVEAARLAAIETDFLYETGAVINSLPFPASAYGENAALALVLRRDGIDL
jgi:predicted nucleotidyltransferase